MISCGRLGRKERSKNTSLQRLYSYVLFINNFRAFFIICSLVTRLWTCVRVDFFSRWFCYERALLLLLSNRWLRLAAFVASCPETRDEPAVCVCACIPHVRAQSARQRLQRSALWGSRASIEQCSDHRMHPTNPNALWDTSVYYIRVQKSSLDIRTLVQNGGAPF